LTKRISSFVLPKILKIHPSGWVERAPYARSFHIWSVGRSGEDAAHNGAQGASGVCVVTGGREDITDVMEKSVHDPVAFDPVYFGEGLSHLASPAG